MITILSIAAVLLIALAITKVYLDATDAKKWRAKPVRTSRKTK